MDFFQIKNPFGSNPKTEFRYSISMPNIGYILWRCNMNKLEALQRGFKRADVDIKAELDEIYELAIDTLIEKKGKEEMRLGLQKELNSINESETRLADRRKVVASILESIKEKKDKNTKK